jgi:hypothetical protein
MGYGSLLKFVEAKKSPPFRRYVEFLETGVD